MCFVTKHFCLLERLATNWQVKYNFFLVCRYFLSFLIDLVPIDLINTICFHAWFAQSFFWT